jgi:hypothetical protein
MFAKQRVGFSVEEGELRLCLGIRKHRGSGLVGCGGRKWRELAAAWSTVTRGGYCKLSEVGSQWVDSGWACSS